MMTIEELVSLLQQFPKDTVVVLPKVTGNRHPKLTSVSYYQLEYHEPTDQYYETDWITLPDEKVYALILND